MKQYIDFLDNRKVLWIIGFSILSIYFLPYLIKGQGIHTFIYDNLDSNIVWFKILAQSGKIFADSMEIIPNMMNGLPRLSYGSEFNVLLWLYYFFDDFTAYTINDIIVHIVAFIGMILLLSRYIIPKDIQSYNFIIYAVALLFALVPFWANGGLSVSGQPLALYAFLNIRSKKDNKWDWIIIILLPFYSSFVLAFFFFLFSLGVFFLYDSYKTKKINYTFILAIVLMTSIYLLIDYRLVYNMFIDSSFISHRTEFDIAFQSFDSVYKASHELFLNGQNHTFSLQYRYILPIILLGLFVSLSKNPINKTIALFILLAFTILTAFDLWGILLLQEYSLPLLLLFSLLVWVATYESKIFPFLFILQIIISYWNGFLISELFNDTIYKAIPFLHSFHMRFLMLQPLIWYILLAICIPIIFKKLYYAPLILAGLFFAQLVLDFEYRNFTREASQPITYKTYYAKSLYKEVEEFIGKPKESYRIVNIGIEPAISLYNGFYTIDGYCTNYPLEYKYEFRKIIETYLNQFNKHQGDSHVFDDWGSKLYLLSNQYIYANYKKTSLNNLFINVNVLDDLGTNYIFSAYEIKDYGKMHLKYLKMFSSKDSYWPVYLYELDMKNNENTK